MIRFAPVGRVATGGLVALVVTALVAFTWSVPSSAQELDLGFLTTRAEATDYEQTTRYDEAVALMEAAATQSDLLHLTHFGYSVEGRALPLAIWGVEDPSVDAVLDDPRLRVFVQANIHAGEVCGKEAMLALIRDLAAGSHDAWLESVILLIAPIYNADGNERVDLYNRPRQWGPVGGMGQRPNARDLDLNRDHMKVASPEARSLIGLMNRYDPHVLVDLHTTNGTQHGYHLTYSPPLNPNTHPAIDSLLRDELLPSVTETIRARYGWDFYYYGNLPFRNAEPGWYTFDHRPRFNNNYVGLRNRVAILSEAYSYASFRDRVLATRAFVEEIITYAAENAAVVRGVIEEAESDSLPGSSFAVQAAFQRSAEPADIILGGTERIRNPYSGAVMLAMTEERRVERMYEYGAFQATESVTLPAAYLIPERLSAVLNLLDDHGIVMTSQASGFEGAEAFAIDSTHVAERPFQGVQERALFGSWHKAEPPGSQGGWVRVDLAQPLGRLAAYLLEPRSDDGVVNWGILDEALEGADTYPILRLPLSP